VVGNSFGAALAWRLAADAPASVGHLILVNGGPLPVPPPWLRALLKSGAVAGPMQEALRWASFRRKAVERALVDLAAFPEDFIDRALAGARQSVEIGYDAVRLQPPRLERARPTALLWGAEDSLATLAMAERFAQRAKIALHPIVGAGHLPQVQMPATFAKKLLPLLQP
jgi:pimeloyl-ACP methyl ester carboxylesterase